MKHESNHPSAPTLESLVTALTWLDHAGSAWVRGNNMDVMRNLASAKMLIQRYVDWHSPLPEETALQFDVPQVPDSNGACVQCERVMPLYGGYCGDCYELRPFVCSSCGSPMNGVDSQLCVQCEGALEQKCAYDSILRELAEEELECGAE